MRDVGIDSTCGWYNTCKRVCMQIKRSKLSNNHSSRYPFNLQRQRMWRVRCVHTCTEVVHAALDRFHVYWFCNRDLPCLNWRETGRQIFGWSDGPRCSQSSDQDSRDLIELEK